MKRLFKPIMISVIFCFFFHGSIMADVGIPEWTYTDPNHNPPWDMSMSSDGSYIAAGTSSTIILFSSSLNVPLWTFSDVGYIKGISISADGTKIMATSNNYYAYLLGNSNSTPIWSYNTTYYANSASISRDGSTAVVSNYAIYLFDTSGSDPLWTFSNGYTFFGVDTCSDGSIIAAANGNGSVYLFSRSSNIPLWTHATGADDVIYTIISDDCSKVAASDSDGRVSFFDTSTSDQLWVNTTGASGAAKLAISEDGSRLAVLHVQNMLDYFDTSSSTPLWSLDIETNDASLGPYPMMDIEMTPDGNYIVAGTSRDPKIVFLQSDSNVPLWEFTATSRVKAVAVSDNGEYVAGGGDDHRVWLFHNVFCRCETGACCDGCNFLGADTVCDESVDEETGCPWGEEPGSDVGRRVLRRYCPGESADCDGAEVWTEWEIVEDCTIDQFCDPVTISCMDIIPDEDISEEEEVETTHEPDISAEDPVEESTVEEVPDAVTDTIDDKEGDTQVDVTTDVSSTSGCGCRIITR